MEKFHMQATMQGIDAIWISSWIHLLFFSMYSHLAFFSKVLKEYQTILE